MGDFAMSWQCGIIIRGRVAEWFKALVLKTSIRKYRKFESCPFRHVPDGTHQKARYRISRFALDANLVPSAKLQ